MVTKVLVLQIVLQIAICFSVLNVIFTLSINKENKFSKLFGLSFLISFVMSISGIFVSNSIISQILSIYHIFFFLGTLTLLSFLWALGKHKLSMLLVWFLPILGLLLIEFMPLLNIPLNLSAVVLSPVFLIGLTILIIATLLHILVRMIREKDSKLLLSIIILGIFQIVKFIMPMNLAWIIIFGDFLGYLTAFLYVLTKSRDPYLIKIKEAEAKLIDVNKTINYEVKRRLLEVERHNEHLLNMAQKDPLVDAYNKKGIMNLMGELVHDPSKEPFTILLFDIDNFKTINDTKGHIAGDMILKKVCNIAKANIRGFDILGRYGGDEFLIILPGTKISDALFIAERFRKKVDTESEITVSIGAAAFPDDGDTIKKLIEAADAGLYKSKSRGKNTVSHYPFQK